MRSLSSASACARSARTASHERWRSVVSTCAIACPALTRSPSATSISASRPGTLLAIRISVTSMWPETSIPSFPSPPQAAAPTPSIPAKTRRRSSFPSARPRAFFARTRQRGSAAFTPADRRATDGVIIEAVGTSSSRSELQQSGPLAGSAG